MILVDTCIWSEALRKKKSNRPDVIDKLTEIINTNQAHIIGPIRQELLSGVKEKKTFNSLKNKLSYFQDIELKMVDFETAAEYFNLCQSKGIQGSNTDFLISAASTRLSIPIFTIDNDFDHFKKVLKLKLLKLS